MLKTTVLLFAMALSIVCGAPQHENINQAVVVKEIIKTLVDIKEALIKTAACENRMVVDVFSNTDGLRASDAFCKAAKTLLHRVRPYAPCKAIRKNIDNLKENLLKLGNEATNCTMDHSKTDLNEFIAQLLKFSRQYYSFKH